MRIYLQNIAPTSKRGGAECSVIYGDAELCYSRDNTPSRILQSISTNHKYHHRFMHQSAFIALELLRFYYYDTHFRVAGDTDFFTKAYNNGARFRHFDEIVSSFRLDGLSDKISFQIFREDLEIGRKYNKFFPIFHALRWIFVIIPKFYIRKILPQNVSEILRQKFGKKKI